LQSTIDSALLPKWGNTAEYVAKIQVPAGEQVFIGKVSAQLNETNHLVGGGNQYFFTKRIPDSWIVK
jgi:hypothetical protein